MNLYKRLMKIATGACSCGWCRAYTQQSTRFKVGRRIARKKLRRMDEREWKDDL